VIGPVRVAQQATLPPGDVDVMIRPERLRLRPPGETGGADNPIDLVVDDIINYGDSILVIGKARGLPLRARIVGDDGERLRPGATLALAWAPVDAHVLPRR
jgi:putative spermidine/putrescine transport system ATP-binding protein